MLEAQIEALSGQMEEARSKASEAALAKQRLESQIELLKEQINTAKANDEHIQNRMEAIRGEQAQRKDCLLYTSAVQEGHVFCTSKNLYQASMELGAITADIRRMLNGETEGFTYLYPLQ